ncbi:ADP compounds hydrolase NudE [Colwellia sp. E2M01]|uniref:ADP compounds hydrolase NudE n=1 Tax=Colwellia sp. E2M01 TaxID=2841561 RepID=UPI001C090EA9|nr:ADP compounds hydrolase NudE [Colwellia sp. E2M01]MBU2869153.1 ADP compounds hydrolase NudE [Colwellia sp. E2M01]
MSNKNQLPIITDRKQVAKSALFGIEQIDLTFSNGEQRQYERMMGSGRGAVMIVPMIDDDTLLLVREYCAGTHSYLLGFPKGLIDEGELAEHAANRELQEEVGFASKDLHKLSELMMAPAFFNAKMTIFLAKELYSSVLEGDEPEPLEVVTWSIKDYKELLQQEDFTEARSIAALMLLRDFLQS